MELVEEVNYSTSGWSSSGRQQLVQILTLFKESLAIISNKTTTLVAMDGDTMVSTPILNLPKLVGAKDFVHQSKYPVDNTNEVVQLWVCNDGGDRIIKTGYI